MLTESEIIEFINEDRASDKKQFARIGLKYYEGEHDILNYKLYFYNADGELVEDTTRSNIKISHPFFTELVDKKFNICFRVKTALLNRIYRNYKAI